MTSSAELDRVMVAMLTAHVNNTPIDTAPMFAELADPYDLVYLLTATLKMLANEIHLGCADAGITTDEYLAHIGLKVA